MLMVRRALMWVSLLLISGSLFFLLRILAWSNRLDGDLTFSYECCTQEAGTLFHAHFWSVFYLAAKFGLAGCVGLAMTLRSRTTCKVGIWTLSIGAGLLICSFLMIHGGWFGATVFALTEVVFCAGLGVLAIGTVRLVWEKFHRSIDQNTA
jgi:hypothetical protein